MVKFEYLNSEKQKKSAFNRGRRDVSNGSYWRILHFEKLLWLAKR